MQATFRLHSSELTEEFFASLKTLANGYELTLTLSLHEASEEAMEEDESDETERIRRNPELHEELLRRLKEVDEGKVIAVDMDKILAGLPPQDSIITEKTTIPLSNIAAQAA
jgi:hypothetical protein